MPTSVPPRSTRRPTRARGVLGFLLAGVLAVTLLPLSGPSAQAAPRGAESGTSTSSDLTLVHANILTTMSVDRFQADVRTVLARKSDFVTYNEIPFRQDGVLAPSGYGIYRNPKNRYTAATAVVWRTDRWTRVDAGSFRISNYRKIPPGRKTRLGLRFANWVTLRSPEGRQVSVVAVHVPPVVRKMPDLVRPTVERIGKLVGRLAPSGPVLVGGDFNVHYTSGRYPRDLFKSAEMVPTYDALGSHFPTGDHRGATIDYIFNRGAGVLGADHHSAFELKSDHDGVLAGFSWLVDAPEETQQLVSDPDGDSASQRRVLNALISEVRAAPAGGKIDIVTAGFGPRRLVKQVRAAVARGVQVRLITRSTSLTTREQNLARYLRAAKGSANEVRRCRDACMKAWKRADIARGFVLVRDSRGNAVRRMDPNRYLTRKILTWRTTLTVRTGSLGLADAEDKLAAIS